MRTRFYPPRILAGLALLGGLVFGIWPTDARADNAEKLYDVEMTATPTLENGQTGELVVNIKPRSGAEIHKEAPISLVLDTRGVKTAKARLGRGELSMQGEDGSFTVPFTAVEKGAATIDANLTFFVCTDKLCARQQRKMRLPVSVDG